MCENICPNHALFLSGKGMTLESVVKEIKEDVPFYRSGGGVTFSGGEPLLQYLFCAEAARECKKSGIGVIIDTAGNVPFDRFSELIPYTDEFYYDVKATEQRSAEINCDYSLISANLILLSETARVTVRVPIIPVFNDNADFINSLAVLLKKTQVKNVTFLPFHRLGFSKYEALGLINAYADKSPPKREKIAALVSPLSEKYNIVIK